MSPSFMVPLEVALYGSVISLLIAALIKGMMFVITKTSRAPSDMEKK